MDEKNLQWLAGLLEGEGSFLKPAPSEPKLPRIKIEMTDEDVIHKVAGLFEVKYYATLNRNDGRKVSYKVQVKGRRAISIMQQIFPLMGIRRKQQIENVTSDVLRLNYSSTNENLLYWLAGVLEGEGSFLNGVSGEPNKKRIQVQMCDKDVIERIAPLFGTSTKGPFRPSNDKEHFKSRYVAVMTGAKAVELMRQLHPPMGQRRQAQIDAALESYIPDMDHGDNHPQAKLTAEKVREIKLRLSQGEKLTHLASEYKVDKGLIWQIKAGRIWQHVSL